MGLRINTNVISLVSQRNLSRSAKNLNRSLERLSSGLRINNARDDAAGLAISEGLRSNIRGIRQAVRNANDGIGYLQTAEGALAELTNISQRVRELAVQAANGTLSGTDRGYLDSEAQALLNEFERIAQETDFNGVKLLDGSFTTTDLQVGAAKGQTISFTIGDARTSQIGALASKSGAFSIITTAISGANLQINSNLIGAAVSDGVSYAGGTFSAIAIARAVNLKEGVTDVKAYVQDNVVTLNEVSFGTFTSGILLTGEFRINNVNITGTGVGTVATMVTAINAVQNQTGVVATIDADDTDDIVLTANDGRNIVLWLGSATSANYVYSAFDVASSNNSVIFNAANMSAGNTSTSGYINVGRVDLQSSASFTVSMSTGTASTVLGFVANTFTVDTTTAVNSVDISTQTGAADALSVLDSTLRAINGSRSDLGSVGNRLESTISNLSIALENLSAAESQIRDADVAAETAELTRAQILQQAGISVLAQANVSTQIALSLLQF